MDEKNKADQYAGYLNSHILPFIDYTELQASYASDMVYAKGILNRLHEALVDSYGSEMLDPSHEDQEFVMVPGILRGRKNGDLCIALFDLDLTSSGEHWGTVYLCGHGTVSMADVNDDSAAIEMNKKYIPFDYCYTATIPFDIHVDKNRLPEEIKQALKDFRNHHAVLTSEQESFRAAPASPV